MAFKFLSVFNNRHFHSLTGNLVTAFFNVLSFALLVRILSLDAFGEWVIFLGTYNVLDQVRTALLQSGIIKFYAGVDENTAKQVAGAAWYLSLVVTAIFVVASFAVYFTGYNYFEPTWHFFIRWIGLLTLFSLPFNFATWVLQASHRFNKIVHIRILQNGSFLAFLIALYLLKQVSLENVLYAYALSLILASAYSLVFRWTLIRSMAFRTKTQVLELYRFGRLIVGSMLSSSLLNYSDNMIIRAMISPAAVAIYSIPQKFMEVIEIILRSFVATAQPTISAAANRKDWPEVARAFARYTGIVTIMIVPFIFLLFIFTKPLILILAEEQYLNATILVRIILLSAILFPIDRFIGVTLDMINKPQVNFYKNLLKLILNIILDIALVWAYTDVSAVAVASVLNLIFAVAFGYYFLRKYIHIEFKQILVAGWQDIKMLIGKKLFK